MDRPPAFDLPAAVGFLPGVAGGDALARYWLGQATLRLRREVCWLWRERERSGPEAGSRRGALPPLADRGLTALDHARYDAERSAFFAADVTARYLSDQISTPPPAQPDCGAFAGLAHRLRLAPVECFVLGLALLPCADSAAGAVVATCHNDATRCEPTLALAQRLWDRPDELLCCFDPGHALLRHGVLALGAPGATSWQAPLAVPPLVARQLLLEGAAPAAALEPIAADDEGDNVAQLAARFTPPAGEANALSVVPLVGSAGAPLPAAAAACAARLGLRLVGLSPALDRGLLAQAMSAAWLAGQALFIDGGSLPAETGHEFDPLAWPLPGLPLWTFVGCEDASLVRRLGRLAHKPLELEPPSYPQRLAAWQRALPAADTTLLAEAARRYRLERAAIARLGAALSHQKRAPSATELFAAALTGLDLGTLAQAVQPRFTLAELMLAPAAGRQVREMLTAMRNLGRAHYEWGTARAWAESGLAALFAGPPGTGKTMCAEAMAQELSMPMYRIDLSQVVDKYIGQTEKNLRQLFDQAERGDVILFFDEADALFGRRTEVKDAHDRYANLEVSYLLERMERFKGLAILATNRRKDLDDAFLRRLRFVIEFALPEAAERTRIWRSLIPPGVDSSELDFDFLAQRFALSGGHIRAIVFHACLLAAGEGALKRLTMPEIVRAVQREYDKLERAHSLSQFGPYAPLVAAQKTGT